MGNRRLYDIIQEKDALYAKEDFSDEDGERASVLEGEFAELNGWEAESDASKLDFPVVDINDMRADVIQEMTVMRHHDYRAEIIRKEILQPRDSVHIEMVGRLVREIHVFKGALR